MQLVDLGDATAGRAYGRASGGQTSLGHTSLGQTKSYRSVTIAPQTVSWSDRVLRECDNRSTRRPYTVSRADDDERAARGVPALLRAEGAPARALALADPAGRRPDDPLHRRGDAAVQGLLPAHEGAAARPGRERPEMPARGWEGHRSRRCRAHGPP